ncbi:hypothetical protein DESUT3_39330 [Desulfuromonas versatilis]|uniref:CheW-like domain-containing protein n=1 Tax=Desulfuromonas versatilis TaxID=2802975 RepID=A0ABM8HXV8_9BACT|nr:chemotaxis protein CheW [Desulfuromonas versatilis]BCR06864.1 hypothetical protein DESUT3_39330 [Desulfuromonas versatilis]
MEQVLTFRLGAEHYGLEIAHLQEIVESPPIYQVPRGADWLLGAINVHGSILPVLDLAALLGFDNRERDPRVIVLSREFGRLALAVAALGKIVPLDPDALLPVQQQEQQTACIRGVLNLEADMVNLLDMERLLGSLEKI